jgi:hypothetical protein
MSEKILFMHWADKGHNAPIISAKKESYFGSSALKSFEGTGVHSATFNVGSTSPSHSHDGTAGRIISRIARHAQVGEISQLDSFTYR